MVFSIIIFILVTPVLYLIIQFEKDKHNRTLINQLVTVLVYIVTIPNILLEFLSLYLFIFNGTHEVFCYMDLIFRPSLVMLNILVIDAIGIVRFVFIFYLKNPTATQDDFWKMFLVTWIIGFTFLTHFVFAVLPGRNPNSFYICLKSMPKSYENQETKINWTLIWVMIVSLFAHVAIGIRYLYYAKREQHIIDATLTQQDKITRIKISKSSMVNFSTNIFGVLFLLSISYVPQRVKTTSFSKLNNYSEYIWVYVMYFYIPAISQIVATIVLVTRNLQLKRYIKREIYNFLGIQTLVEIQI